MTIIRKDAALVARLRNGLLDWYDAHGRDLVWRRGARDPYRVWLSEVMLQQTTVPHATPYYEKFLSLWPTARDLAAADDARVMAEWAGLGYYARARRLLECVRVVVRDHGGEFPRSVAELLALPGFGPYTAAAVAAIAFGAAANVVDGNVERVMTRLYAIETPLPAGRADVREAAAQWIGAERAGDWPQALMDLASLICRPKAPQCLLCPLAEACEARAQGEPERYPVKLTKPPKSRRFGTVYILRLEGAIIAEQRPDKGLLGGMLGLPHSEWRSAPDEARPPLDGDWRDLGAYQHVFTHFALTQSVRLRDVTRTEADALLRARNDWRWLPLAEARSLPTVFAKALKLMKP
ncbi:MAG TPA: A/G-specific adenine glycosylase [Asticcacaulis sp.]|nr:A/G-specific adenine glycosylase [Asticcacaulis sp.]